MKKLVVGLMLSLSLVACGNNSTAPAPAPTVTVTQSTPTTTPAESLDQKYLAFVRNGTTTLDNVPDEAIIKLAKTACSALESGISVDDLASTLAQGANSDAQAEDLGYIVGAGVAAYCPKFNYLFRGSTA